MVAVDIFAAELDRLMRLHPSLGDQQMGRSGDIGLEQKERRGRSRLATSPPVWRFNDYQKKVVPTETAWSWIS
jgi:hypothetical protein